MTTRLQLEGQVDVSDSRDDRIRQLEDELRRSQRTIADVKEELEMANRRTERAVSELRRQLNPLFQALRAVFGEIDAIAPEELSSATAAPPSRSRGVWESWKEKLGAGKAADLIDALLDHGEMNAVQLRVAMKCHINTVYEMTAKLQKLGLVNKIGSKYSLKEL